jgi:hypothetical protein
MLRMIPFYLLIQRLQNFYIKTTLFFTKCSEHHKEEVEGDGVRVGEGEHE